jgi:hypothetical protein
MAEVHSSFMNAVLERIKGLELPGHPRPVIRRWPWSDTHIHSGITIHPTPESEAPGTNEREDIGYGVGVTMILPTDHGMTENVERIPIWRAKIRRAFINQRLRVKFDGASEHVCKVEHGNFPLPREAHKYEVSSLIIRCWMRESRNT